MQNLTELINDFLGPAPEGFEFLSYLIASIILSIIILKIFDLFSFVFKLFK